MHWDTAAAQLATLALLQCFVLPHGLSTNFQSPVFLAGARRQNVTSSAWKAQERTVAQWVSDVSSQEAYDESKSKVRKGSQPLCYAQRDFGLGDRLEHLLRIAIYSWNRQGSHLLLDWGRCGGQPLFAMLFDDKATFTVSGLGEFRPYDYSSNDVVLFENDNKKTMCTDGRVWHCGREGPEDQDERPDDYMDELSQWDFDHKQYHHMFVKNEVVGVVSALQKSLRSRWSGMAEHLVNRAAAGGRKVIGVHLRLGNGEAAFSQDGRSIDLQEDQIILLLEGEIERLASERGWAADGYSIVLATDTTSMAQRWNAIRPDKVYIRSEGCSTEQGEGIQTANEEQKDPEECSCIQGTAWADATALGLADLLIAPTWSSLMLLPKAMILAHGGEVCLDAKVGGNLDDSRFGQQFSCVSKSVFDQGFDFPGEHNPSGRIGEED